MNICIVYGLIGILFLDWIYFLLIDDFFRGLKFVILLVMLGLWEIN